MCVPKAGRRYGFPWHSLYPSSFILYILSQGLPAGALFGDDDDVGMKTDEDYNVDSDDAGIAAAAAVTAAASAPARRVRAAVVSANSFFKPLTRPLYHFPSLTQGLPVGAILDDSDSCEA